ncbi:type II toxin-antitoxin system Phd/YefM family antitoxin [Patescibacteria group bacterium]|nr:type II toxin-antitoxin system Phd/YefM family antitoxin [Patescibacteria group bacterium]
MTTRFVGVKELRQNMAKLTKRAKEKNERLIILRKNEPIFELRPLSKTDAKLEKLMLDIKEAQEDIKAGRLYTIEEVEKALGL